MIFKKFISIITAVSLVMSLSSCSVVMNINVDTTTEESSVSNVVRVTLPEGFTIAEMAQKLEENGVCSADDFMAAANDESYLEEFGIEITNPENRAFVLEGYLFPDTYDFYTGENIDSVIKKFLRNFNSKITDDMKTRAEELGYTVDEIITLASIVQEEGGVSGEATKVSSVLHNRLNSPSYSRLQCDVSIAYLEKYVKPYVTDEEYETFTELYNTYKCTGLPEGSITNPGMLSINAALYPEETDYYFFVTDDNGVYYYAHDWQEHQENCSAAGL